MELDPVEIRVLGCLVEKQRTTPDAYPLTLNALRLACNQTSNREPVVDYDEATVREAAQRLGRRRLARSAAGHGGRTPKYRHLAEEALGVAADELALLCLLMLRGPQTLGELKARSERLHAFPDLDAVEATAGRLVERGLAARRERQPGQKEQRYEQLLGGEPAVEEAPPAPAGASDPGHREPTRRPPALESRLARLEEELRELRGMVEALRRELGG